MSEETAPTYRPAWPDPLSLSRDELTELGLVLPGVVVLPILHGRLEFAWMVRRAIERLTPAALAVEYPESLGEPIRRAVNRLPLLSVVEYPDAAGRPVYLPIEPADALVEAVRRGLELGIPVHMVDRDVDRYPEVRDRLPDPLAAESAGARAYLASVLALVEHNQRVPEDDQREHTMAFNVAALVAAQPGPEATVLVICGLHHARGLVRNLFEIFGHDHGPVTPLRRLKREGVAVHHLAESASREVLAELPFVNAAYERSRGTAPPSAEGTAHNAAVVDLFTRARQRPRIDPFRTAAPPEISEDRPRATGRMGLLLALCQQARARYRDQTGESLRPGTLLQLLRYACRYAYLEGGLGPDLYQLVIAARGYADDNYAHEVWEVATHYPWQTSRPELAPLELSLRDLHEHVRSIRFHPKTLQRRHRLMRVIRPRPSERRAGEWAEQFDGENLCSYPPEDLALEHYGAFLRKRTERLQTASQTTSEPFSTSLHDGIDVRETLRNWHTRTLYVRRERPVRGKPGAVVVIFEDEPLQTEEPRFPWHMCWQGEHDEEGDMALYATDPFARVVGPGIGKALYGGFLLTRPPGTMFGVWQDPYYSEARSKAELLLLAALDHSPERLIVYVAPSPPRQAMRQAAQRMDRKIVHVPLGQLSPVTLKRLRVFHVLSDRAARAGARAYIRD
jgi:hypothetical protein